LSSGHCSSDRFLCCLLLAFSQNNSNFLDFCNFRFEIRHTPSAPQCATFSESVSTSDFHVTPDQPKCAEFDSIMLMRFWKFPGKLNFRVSFGHSCSCITLLPTPHLGLEGWVGTGPGKVCFYDIALNSVSFKEQNQSYNFFGSQHIVLVTGIVINAKLAQVYISNRIF
jgi:hypothetical protein